MCSTMIIAVFHDEIRMAIPGIIRCLKDSEWKVRQAAIYGLSDLAANRMCHHLFSSLILSIMVVLAEFHDKIRIPGIMACLKDSQWKVREAAINTLSSLAVHCMCYHSPFDALNYDCSWISRGNSQSHSWHHGMSQGFAMGCSRGSHLWTFKSCSTSYVLISHWKLRKRT